MEVVACLKFFGNEWFGIEECRLDNFVHAPVVWVCNKETDIDGAGKQT